jgi:hypothetical protein
MLNNESAEWLDVDEIDLDHQGQQQTPNTTAMIQYEKKFFRSEGAVAGTTPPPPKYATGYDASYQWRRQTVKKWTQTKYFSAISGQLVVIYHRPVTRGSRDPPRAPFIKILQRS